MSEKQGIYAVAGDELPAGCRSCQEKDREIAALKLQIELLKNRIADLEKAGDVLTQSLSQSHNETRRFVKRLETARAKIVKLESAIK